MYSKIITLLLIVNLSSLYAQDITVSDTTTITSPLLFEVPTFRYHDTENCTNEYVYPGWAGNYYRRSFTYHPNGTYYACSFTNQQVNPPSAFTEILPVLDGYGDFPVVGVEPPDNLYALAVSATGTIYFAGESVFSYNPSTGEEFNFGLLPETCQTPIAMSHRLGEYFIITQNYSLYKIDPINPGDVEFLFDLPSTISNIKGLTTIHNTCSDTDTYLTGIENSVRSYYIIDFVNSTLIQGCETDLRIESLASDTEPFIPECELFIDLDSDDSSGEIGFNYLSDTSCVTPLLITDSDPIVYSETGVVDRITIELIDDDLPGILDCSLLPEFTVFGIGTDMLNIVNTAGASFGDFSQILQTVQYIDETNTYGTVEVEFTIHASEYSNNAFALLPIFPQELYVDAGISDVSCFSASDGSISVTLNNSNTDFDALWSNGFENPTIENLSEGSYSVVVTGANGCTGTDTFQINEPDLLLVNINNEGSDTICTEAGTLTALATGGSLPYEYLWSSGGENNVESMLGDGVHTVTITDANDCTVSESYQLFTQQIMTILDVQICEGEEYEVGNQVFDSETNTQIVLESYEGCDSIVNLNLAIIDLNEVSEEIILCEGDFYVINNETIISDTVIVRVLQNFELCDSIVSTNIIFEEFISIQNASICEGEEFAWQGEIISSAGTYSDTLESLTGCDSIIVLELQETVLPVPVINALGDLCNGEAVTLSVEEDFSDYYWSTGENASSVQVFTEGNYTFEGINDMGCTVENSIEITGSLLETEIEIIHPTCPGLTDGTIIITNTEGGNNPYLYSLNGLSFNTDTFYLNLASGDYVLLVEDSEGCREEISFSLEEPALSTINLIDEVRINLGDSIFLNPLFDETFFNNYLWTPSEIVSCDTCISASVKPTETTEVTFSVSNDDLCLQSASVLIFVDKNIDLYAPTAFSPDNNGINDIFYLQSKNDLPVEQIQIFDRWGNLHFSSVPGHTNDPGIGWDGTTRSGIIAQGVYVWTARVVLPDGERRFLSGEVSVL